MTSNRVYAIEFKPYMEPALHYIPENREDAGRVLNVIRESAIEAGIKTYLSIEHGYAVDNLTGEQSDLTSYRVSVLPDGIWIVCEPGEEEVALDRATDSLWRDLHTGDEFAEEEDY